MTGQELIDYIREHHLEDYVIVVRHDTGSSAYPVYEIYIDETYKEIELY